MGLARQEHDARIQPWERFATQSTEPALVITPITLEHEVTLYKLAYTNVQVDAKVRSPRDPLLKRGSRGGMNRSTLTRPLPRRDPHPSTTPPTPLM